MGQVINLADASFRRPTDLPCTCSDAHLLEAVRGWMLNAPSEQVARLLQVKVALLPQWINSHGWQEIVLMLKDEVRAISYGAYGRLGLKAFQALEERLDEGDPIMGFGEDGVPAVVGHKPLRGKDLAEIITRLGTRQDEIEKRIGKGPNDEDQIPLKDLALALKKYAMAKEIDLPKENVVEVTDTTK